MSGGVVRSEEIGFTRADAHKPIEDPGPGRHLWIVTVAYRVNPLDGPGTYHLDMENLLDAQGPGCLKCEQIYTAEVAATPCVGSLDELMPR